MIKLDVTTSIRPLVQIKVFIDHLDSADDILFRTDEGFSKKFDLPKGKYILTVSGMNGRDYNGINGITTVKLSGNFESGPDPDSPQSSNDDLVYLPFKFEI